MLLSVVNNFLYHNGFWKKNVFRVQWNEKFAALKDLVNVLIPVLPCSSEMQVKEVFIGV